MISKWKVIVSRVFFEHGGKADKNGQRRILSVLEILKPNEVCTETYVVVNQFETEIEAQSFYGYLKTKFARYLILQATSSIMITKSCFTFVPEQDYAQEWTDIDLYNKYSLSQEEINTIETEIREMD